MAKTEGFYRELDKSKDRKGSCNCLSLAIIFFILLFAIELVLFLVSRNFKFNPKQVGDYSVPVLSEGKISPVDLGNNMVRITISQGQLCKIIQESGVNVKDLACQINDEAVHFSGKISSFLPSNTTISIIPTAQNGKIALEVKEVEVGTIDLSPSLFTLFIGKIEGQINSNEAIKNIKVTKCELSEGMMVIEGTK